MQQLLPQCPQAAWASKSAASSHKHHKTAFGNANAGGGFFEWFRSSAASAQSDED